MEVILLSTPGDCAKLAHQNTFETSKRARDFTIASSGRLKSAQETNVVTGICVTKI